jgi:hypothetical protein
MVTVAIKEVYVDLLSSFGDISLGIDLALKRYAIEQITTKITELRQRELTYQIKYGLPYMQFKQHLAEDENFVIQIETQINKLRELDLADWEFCHEGINDWTRKLQTTLLI